MKECNHKGSYGIWLISYAMSRTGKSVEGEVTRLVVAWSWRWNGKILTMGMGFHLEEGRWKCSKMRQWWWFYNSVNTLKTIEAHPLNGWILWWVNHVPIKAIEKEYFSVATLHFGCPELTLLFPTSKLSYMQGPLCCSQLCQLGKFLFILCISAYTFSLQWSFCPPRKAGTFF